jgi:hypothetical protein
LPDSLFFPFFSSFP